MLRQILAAVLVATSALPALAGDFAERSLFGFSADGGRFAFEEFGIQDGSGFPYANVYVVDAKSDKGLPKMPIGARFDNETVRIPLARYRAREKAAPFLKGLDQPGRLLASNPITESGRNPYEIVFKRHPEQLVANPDWTLTLDKIPLPATASPKPEAETVGFRLTLRTDKGETVLQEDKALPKGRGNALDYRISDVLIYEPPGGQATLAVLVMVLTPGFEGPNGRFLAVTARLPG